MRRLLLLFIAFLFASTAFCEEKTRVYPLNPYPQGWENQGFQFCYFNGDHVFNNRSKMICKPNGVLQVRISPAKFSFAVLHAKGKKDQICIYSMVRGKCLAKLKMSSLVTDFIFTPNARHLVVANENRQIITYETKKYKQVGASWELPIVPDRISMSDNGYFLAVTRNKEVNVYNYENHKLRKNIKTDAIVTHVTFSEDNRHMGVMLKSGVMKVYDTRNFNEVNKVENLGRALNFEFHPAGKYICAVTADNRISIINLKDKTEVRTINTDIEGIDHIGYASTVAGDLYLVYNTYKQLAFSTINDLIPDFFSLANDYATEQMTEWVKQRPDESDEAFHARLDPQQRKAQQTKFTNAKATEFAGSPVQNTKITISGYNETEHILILNVENMNDIRISIPPEEAENFSGDVSFENVTYYVDENDNFHIYEADIIDNKTGKRYHYVRSDVTAPSDEKLVPLDVLKKTNEEQRRLEQLKREIMSQAKDSNLITDHTNINVKTTVETADDADGNEILNYIIDVNYVVDSGFTQEDFLPGKYIYSESNAATAMLQVIHRAFNENFARYLRKGKKVVIDVYGSADSSPILKTLSYNSEYGDFENELVYNNNELTAITVTKETGISTNEQLSFIRAAGVRDYIEKNIPEISDMLYDYLYHITVSTESGNQHRRIGVKFVFIDVFH